MIECTEFIISLKLEEYNPARLLEEVLGKAFKAEIEKDNIHMLDTHETDDPLYPSFIEVCWDEQKLGLGEYADIEVAEKLHQKKKINAIISHYGLIGNLDPEDPYWCLVHENGKWYFGDNCDTILGHFSNGSPGIGKVEELDLKKLLARKYVWVDLGLKCL